MLSFDVDGLTDSELVELGRLTAGAATAAEGERVRGVLIGLYVALGRVVIGRQDQFNAEFGADLDEIGRGVLGGGDG